MLIPIDETLQQITSISAWNTAGFGGRNPALAQSLLGALPQGLQVSLLIGLHVGALYGGYRLLRIVAPGNRYLWLRRILYLLASLAYIALAYKLTQIASSYILILPLLALPLQAMLVARALKTKRVLRYAAFLAIVSAFVFNISWKFDLVVLALLGMFGLWAAAGRRLGRARLLFKLVAYTGILMLPLMAYWVVPQLYGRLSKPPQLYHDATLTGRTSGYPLFYAPAKLVTTGKLEQVPEIVKTTEMPSALAVMLTEQLRSGDLLGRAASEFYQRIYEQPASAAQGSRTVETVTVPNSGTYVLQFPATGAGTVELDGEKVPGKAGDAVKFQLAEGEHTISVGPETSYANAYTLSSVRPLPAPPATITYRPLSPTAYKVTVRGPAQTLVAFQQAYHPGWRAYIVRQVPYTTGEKAKRLIGLEDQYRISDNEHVILNGFINGWWIDRSAISGKFIQPDGSYDLIVEYYPQRFVLWGLAAGGATLAGCIYALIITRKKDLSPEYRHAADAWDRLR
jgi:hypothetical protein